MEHQYSEDLLTYYSKQESEDGQEDLTALTDVKALQNVTVNNLNGHYGMAG